MAHDADAFDCATARIVDAHADARRAETAFEAVRGTLSEYIALEAAERAFLEADAAYWRGGESLDLQRPRLAARQAVVQARDTYHAVRESLPEYMWMRRATAHLDAVIRERDEVWPPFSRTAARNEQSPPPANYK